MDSILSKEDIKSTLGNESLEHPRRLVARVSYVSGIPAFDNILQGLSCAKAEAFLKLIARPQGLEIELVKGLASYSVALPYSWLLEISVLNKYLVYSHWGNPDVSKDLTPDPAAAGTKRGERPDLFVSILYAQQRNQDQAILFSCPYQEKRTVINFFNQVLPSNTSK